MTRQVQIIFDSADEREFSVRLRGRFSRTSIIDGVVWSSNEPPLVDSLDQCSQLLAYLWPRDLYPDVLGMKRQDGSYEGPQSGIVIQVIRSSCVSLELEGPPALSSGRLAWGSDPNYPGFSGMKGFVNDVFSFALEFAAARGYADFGDPPPKWPAKKTATGMYLIGPSAYHRWKLERTLSLRDRATKTPIATVT